MTRAIYKRVEEAQFSADTYLRTTLYVLALIQLNPRVPPMPVDSQFIPFIQQHRLVRPNHSDAGTAIKP